MTVKITQPKKKLYLLFFRADEDLNNKIMVEVKNHNVERSTAIRRLVELGLEKLRE